MRRFALRRFDRLAVNPLAGVLVDDVLPAVGFLEYVADEAIGEEGMADDLIGVHGTCSQSDFWCARFYWRSKAPMSTAGPNFRLNGAPRWSVLRGLPLIGSTTFLSPRLIAGLPASKA